jgi:hypothetical protein
LRGGVDAVLFRKHGFLVCLVCLEVGDGAHAMSPTPG